MLNAKQDNSGKPVDWWFMYKLPKGIGPKSSKTIGNEYLYYDGKQQKTLSLSAHRLGESEAGALYHTFKQLISKPGKNVGWIHYNDEYPDSMGKKDWPPKVPAKYHDGKPRYHDHNGHCKGTLAFDLDSDSAFWLSHSTPRIPPLPLEEGEGFFYPDYTFQYAQTFICITLDSIATANKIAAVMNRQHEPQVFGCRLPGAVSKNSDWSALWELAQGSLPPNYDEEYAEKHPQRAPADLSFKSKGGKSFRLLAKSGAWYDDFWLDLVGPKLNVDLRVETWRRLTTTTTLPSDDNDDDGKSDFGTKDFVTNYKGHEYHHEFVDNNDRNVVDETTSIDLRMLKDNKGKSLKDYQWSYTKDHAKWAISELQKDRGDQTIDEREGTEKDWVCVADMNRMSSQRRRGGGAICFHEPMLWKNLNKIEQIGGKIT